MLNLKKFTLTKNRYKTKVDVHPTERAIIVDYLTEVTIKDANNEIVHKEVKETKKTFHIENFNFSSDIKAITRSLLDQCSLLKLKNIPNIEQSLRYIYSRKKVTKCLNETMHLPLKDLDLCSKQKKVSVRIERLRSYQELLYEPKVELKLEGSGYLLLLTKDLKNLQALAQTPSFFTSLSRVLKENCFNNFELSQNILHIFFVFSTYTNFHKVLLENKIGSLVYHVIDNELKNYSNVVAQLKSKINDEAAKKRCLYAISEQDKMMKVAFYFILNLANDPRTEVKMFRKGICQLLLRVLGCRENEDDLTMVLLTFLIKFTLKNESKNELIENNVVGVLHKTLKSSDNNDLIYLCLVVIYNLSFDTQFIVEAVTLHKYLELLVSLLGSQSLALKILYQASCHRGILEKFQYKRLINYLSDTLLSAKETDENEDYFLVRAILLNIVYDLEICEIIVGQKLIKKFMLLAMESKDALLMKILRVISAQYSKEIRLKFLHFIQEIVNEVKTLEYHPIGFDSIDEVVDFKVECLGLLSNLQVTGMNYYKVLMEFQLLDWMEKFLGDSSRASGVNIKPKSEDAQDDILLCIFKFLSFASIDSKVSLVLIKRDFIKLLVKILNYKQEDDQIVYYIISTFFMFLLHQETRQRALDNADILAYLIDLMGDSDEKIKKMADQSLDIIAESDPVYAATIQNNRFTSYNANWLKNIREGKSDSEEETDQVNDLKEIFKPEVLRTMSELSSMNDVY